LIEPRRSKTLALQRANEVLEYRLFVERLFESMAEMAQHRPQAAFVAGGCACSSTKRSYQAE
jgi:hypothetical protein